MKIVFYDTETSWLTKEDRLYQLAYRIINFSDWSVEKDFNQRFNIPTQIWASATAINGTTNKDIEHLPFIHETPFYNEIINDFNIENAYYVAHNALFDVLMLNKEQIKVSNIIDTCQVAKSYLWRRVANHKLQTIKDFYSIDIDAKAHDALWDVIVLEQVFKKLFYEVKFVEVLRAKTVSDIMNFMEKTTIDWISYSKFADNRTNFIQAKKFNWWEF